jgi:hypothetical protein
MLETVFFMIAMAVHGASSTSGAPSQSADIAAADGTEAQESAAPLFLAPAPEPDTAAPVFLAPARQAEPQVPTGKFTTATEVKPILGATKGNWVAVREFNGQDLIYVTHLWSWRCGLIEMRVGLNGAAPEIWPLPKCHDDQPAPNMILESDGLPYRSYSLNSINTIAVELVYDDLSEETANFNRKGVQIP